MSKYWTHILAVREIGASRRPARAAKHYDEHSKPLTSLSIGDSVQFQNQEGNYPLRWDKTRVMVERLKHGQYFVKND